MNRLEEIQEIIKNFIYEKQQMKQEISKIENERTVLARERNSKINENNGGAFTEEVQAKVFALGNQIKELGNQSQELQNKLDKKYIDLKQFVAIEINKCISNIMPEIRQKEEEKMQIQQRIEDRENRDARYTKQKQEFFERFGRMPSLSENAMKENQLQEEEYQKNKLFIQTINDEIKVQEDKISKLVKVINDVKRENWEEYIEKNEDSYKQDVFEAYTKKIAEEVINPIVESIIEKNTVTSDNETTVVSEEESIILPFLNEENNNIGEVREEETNILEDINIEEIQTIEEMPPLKEINVQEIELIDSIDIDEVKPIEEIKIEEVNSLEEINIEELEVFDFQEENNVEQTNNENEYDTNNTIQLESFEDQDVEQQEEKTLEEILEEEEEKIKQETVQIKTQKIQNENKIENLDLNNEVKENIDNYENKEETIKINTYFGERVNLLNINAKFEDGEVVYKAQMSNGNCIKLYPRKSETGNIFLKDKENREELKEILINYAIAEYRMFDKKVVKKIDPSICEILIRFAKIYNYDAQNLIYNYAMSFSKNDELELDNIPTITYNFAYLKETNLDKKEKDIITKICKNAKRNSKIDIIGYNTGIKKIKYIFKRTLSISDTNALPEGKY